MMSVPSLLLILGAVCAAILIIFLACHWTVRRWMWATASKIPGPKGWPIIGNSMIFWGTLTETFENLRRLSAQFGPVVGLWAGPQLFVILTDPRDAQRVLGNPRVRNRDENMSAAMRPFFGNGLLSNRDEMWRIHRKFITPAFHFKILETYVDIFASKAAILIEQLDKIADGRTLEIYDPLSMCTLDAICETAIGTTMHIQEHGINDFLHSLYAAVKHIHRRATRPWLLNPVIYQLSREGRRAQPVIKAMRAFSEDIIRTKLAEQRSGGSRVNEVRTASSKKVASFLDMLMEESGSSLSATEIRDEVTTMAAAGLETTATVMSFALLLLALHPDEQRKVQHEMDDLFGDGPSVATPELIARMPLLECVIKETMRLFPVVTLLPRELPEEVTLTSGHVLPRGATAVVFSYIMHRDPCTFPQPDSFQPARWLDPSEDRHPYAYLPFSGGVRNCVGQRYAMLQMKSVLSALIRRYDVTTDFTMETLQRLEISVTLCIDQSIRYQVQLAVRDRFQS